MVPSHRELGFAEVAALFPERIGFSKSFSTPRLGVRRNKVMAGGTPANPATLFGFCLFYEHHGDAVNDRVEDLALGTPEVVRLLELDLGVALGTREDFE